MFVILEKRHSKKNKGKDSEIKKNSFMQKKVETIFSCTIKKLTYQCFMLNRRSIYLALTLMKDIE